MREAILYARGEGDRVDCRLCSHRCRVPEGKRGFCQVRENRGGVLYSLVYGRLAAADVEFMEKKLLYHRMESMRMRLSGLTAPEWRGTLRPAGPDAGSGVPSGKDGLNVGDMLKPTPIEQRMAV